VARRLVSQANLRCERAWGSREQVSIAHAIEGAVATVRLLAPAHIGTYSLARLG